MVELDGLMLALQLHLSKLEDITPESALSLEEYYRTVGEYAAYLEALEIVSGYAKLKRITLTPIRNSFHARIRAAIRSGEEALSQAEQWQQKGREETLRAILKQYFPTRKEEQSGDPSVHNRNTDARDA